MKPSVILAIGVLALGTGSMLPVFPPSPLMQPARAQTLQTATFTVENMTCALCPVTVKTAMERVEGVQSVTIDFEARTAVVTYDPSLANVEKIKAASTNAGYPAAVKG
ncbi:heavy-metal-associated domain-containing protein [Chelativorans intermedius]|uniref:Heavy-metal-associated domain-containing protein n=1 Tax=Chelativorans intermedius TaxID=515947 RepID=A0ABV6DAU0_9HYPH|nr:heavy-metal-associated domain-containing protein [Chelativorans intermedius]MCT9000147.1 heavy-metal-associated domain-containing protein [Chelativorans intermedius]